MLRPKLTSLPGHIQSIYVQNLLKLYCKVLRRLEDEKDEDSLAQVHTTLQEKLPIFVQSGDLEVQERVGGFVFCWDEELMNECSGLLTTTGVPKTSKNQKVRSFSSAFMG